MAVAPKNVRVPCGSEQACPTLKSVCFAVKPVNTPNWSGKRLSTLYIQLPLFGHTPFTWMFTWVLVKVLLSEKDSLDLDGA